MISLQLPAFSHNMIINRKGFPTFCEVQRLNISWHAGLLLSALRTKQVLLPTADTLMLIFPHRAPVNLILTLRWPWVRWWWEWLLSRNFLVHLLRLAEGPNCVPPEFLIYLLRQ